MTTKKALAPSESHALAIDRTLDGANLAEALGSLGDTLKAAVGGMDDVILEVDVHADAHRSGMRYGIFRTIE
jgi:hypothetical protein